MIDFKNEFGEKRISDVEVNVQLLYDQSMLFAMFSPNLATQVLNSLLIRIELFTNVPSSSFKLILFQYFVFLNLIMQLTVFLKTPLL